MSTSTRLLLCLLMAAAAAIKPVICVTSDFPTKPRIKRHRDRLLRHVYTKILITRVSLSQCGANHGNLAVIWQTAAVSSNRVQPAGCGPTCNI
jgi:hypothetical protein